MGAKHGDLSATFEGAEKAGDGIVDGSEHENPGIHGRFWLGNFDVGAPRVDPTKCTVCTYSQPANMVKYIPDMFVMMMMMMMMMITID